MTEEKSFLGIFFGGGVIRNSQQLTLIQWEIISGGPDIIKGPEFWGFVGGTAIEKQSTMISTSTFTFLLQNNSKIKVRGMNSR